MPVDHSNTPPIKSNPSVGKSQYSPSSGVQMDKCQFCLENILRNASICKHCGRTQLNYRELQEKCEYINAKEFGIFFLICIGVAFAVRWWLGLAAIVGVFFWRQHLIEKMMKDDTPLQVIIKYDKIKKASFIRNIIIGVLLLAMLLTNPSDDKCRKEIRNKMGFDLPSIERQNFYLFSLYKAKSLYGKEEYYIGILGQLF